MDQRRFSAAILLSICFGAVHAYGVLLSPIEQWLRITRTEASAAYSVAIVAITVGVFLTSRLERSMGIAATLLVCGGLSLLGLVISASQGSYLTLLLGFSALYGFANGVAYSLSLVLAAQSMPSRGGSAIGMAIAAYGLGAVLFAQCFDLSLTWIAMPTLLVILGVICIVACCVAAFLVGTGISAVQEGVAETAETAGSPLASLWLCYFLAAFAGLMVLAHGPSIAAAGGNSRPGLASGLVSLGSVAGSYIGGIIADRVSGRVSLGVTLLFQLSAVVCLALVSSVPSVLLGLLIAGLSYGAMTSVVPVEVLRISGSDGFARSYGRIVTAWGIAGVAGPVTAGYFYDRYQGYVGALALAAGLSAVAMLLATVRKSAKTASAF